MSTDKLIHDEKPRILLTATRWVRGGGQEKNFIEVARHFRDKYQFTFLIAGGDVEPDMADIGRIYTFPGRARWFLAPVDLVYMAYVILKEHIDIIHAHHRYPAFLACLLRKPTSTKQLTTAHNVFPDKTRLSHYKARLSRWGDHVIAVSHGVEKWLIESCRLKTDRITVIQNGISPPEKWTKNQLEILRSEIGVDPDIPLLCTVGRLLPQKNYSKLLYALSDIKDIDWCLLIIGEGKEKDELAELAAKLQLDDRLNFLGFRDDVAGLMQLSDVYVMSSAWEGLPYVLVEALANSLPVVATDVGGVSEAVLDGETGFLIKPDSTDMLAEKIRILLNDALRRSEMSKRSRQYFENNFMDTAMFKSLDEVYQALL